MKKIKWFTVGFTVMVSLTFLAQPLMAQTYPSRPIQLVLNSAPGDSGDLTGRAIGAELSQILKTPVVPVNKTGGAGAVGADFVAKGKKDGYTILYSYSSIIYTYIMNPENIPYNPFQDLEALCLATSVPLLITVQSDSPWKNFQDLVNYIQKNPGKARGCSTGVGSVGHFNYELIRAETGAAITMVPYKGGFAWAYGPSRRTCGGGNLHVGGDFASL